MDENKEVNYQAIADAAFSLSDLIHAQMGIIQNSDDDLERIKAQWSDLHDLSKLASVIFSSASRAYGHQLRAAAGMTDPDAYAAWAAKHAPIGDGS